MEYYLKILPLHSLKAILLRSFFEAFSSLPKNNQ